MESITDLDNHSVSYRDLLGTADRIIDMDKQIQQVEVTLGETGHKCNSRAVEKLFNNYASYRSHAASRKRGEYSLVSELAILQSCPTVISRLMRRSHSSLLAAKILVLSRLTHKTLSQREDAPPLINSLQNHLISLRRKLLRTIDSRLSDPDADAPVLVEEMCAFSLATSSTPTDVLRHFHHVRLEAINRRLDSINASHDDVLSAMKLYIRTLFESQVIFPKRLADALSKLRLQPLLQQKDVRATSELSLHLHERWISDELRNYTPWPRHDELSPSEADKQLQIWAKQALSAFLSGTQMVLGRTQEPRHIPLGSEYERPTKLESIMALRKAVLEAWPWSGARLPGLDPSDVIDHLRSLFNAQLAAEAHKSASLIKNFISALRVLTKATNRSANTSSTLWAPTLLSAPLTAGAQPFKSAILSAYHGQPPTPQTIAIHSCLQHYESFLTALSALRTAIKEMRETRWDDLLSDTAYDEDIDVDEKQQLLSRDDPRELENALTEALENATEVLNQGLSEVVDGLRPTGPVPTETIALLRVLRVVQRRNVDVGRPALPSSVIRTLHRRLAQGAVASAVSSFSDSVSRFATAKNVVARALWEGSPALPMQPSPAAFKMLRRLEGDMAAFGADLWCGGAVIEIKSALDGEIAMIVRGFEKVVREEGETAINGHERENEGESATDGSEKEELRKEKLTQMLFDALYLQRAVTIRQTSGEESGLAIAVGQLVRDAEVADSELAKLRKSAAEYWKKSYLLFALLRGQ